MPVPPPDIAYTVRRSQRARRVRVTVDPQAGVQVVLPARAPAQQAAVAVVQLRGWIERRMAEADAVRDHVAARGNTVPYLGRDLRLVAQEGRTRVHRRDDDLLVPAGPAAPDAIERWYRRQAREEIAPRMDAAATALGRRYTSLSIRAQKTRWGSCSSTGAMSFNWRLLLAPEPVLDYVVWHEACHLVHMDHSPRFWSAVARHCPGYEQPQRWLRRNGATLVL
ncbi:MAG: family metallopeptidase [Solirubrobacterales bacterium]|jgi:predicted metal-dependent hydrolase|nr:family metallopeptidase [Solirubrobacterales bacterium]